MAYGVNGATASGGDYAPVSVVYAPFIVTNIIVGSTVNLDESQDNPSQAQAANNMKKEMDKVVETQAQEKLSTQLITDALAENPFVIEAEKVQKLLKLTGLSYDQLMQKLIPVIKTLSLPQISNYQVGAVGLGKSGNLYLGVNLEFSGSQLNQSIHGEQFMVVNARLNHETELTHIALSAAPCGHCRQFLFELGDATACNLTILTPNKPARKLSELLPDAFGPQDLGLKGGLLNPCQVREVKVLDAVVAKAMEAANTSYAPYSNSPSGVAILTYDGCIYSGAALENAAYNPSISPFHSALISLIVGGKKYADIKEVVLAEMKEGKVSYASNTAADLKLIAPKATFRTVFLQMEKNEN